MAVELITQSEYARRRNVSAEAVSRAIKANRITLTNGKIDPISADAQWAANSRTRHDAGTPQNSRASDKSDIFATRAKREAVELEIAEMELAEKRGELIPADIVKTQTSAAFRLLYDGVMGCVESWPITRELQIEYQKLLAQKFDELSTSIGQAADA